MKTDSTGRFVWREGDLVVDDVAKSAVEDIEVKREFSVVRRREMSKRGIAMPDGSFPIANVEDLKNAIQAVGRAKNPDAAKAHIKKRAAALGHSDLVPTDW